MKKDTRERKILYYYATKPTIMIKKAKFFHVILTGAFFFSIAIAGCNNEGDSKEVKKDSTTTVKPDSSSKMAPKDTMKMDTSKMPVKKPIVNP